MENFRSMSNKINAINEKKLFYSQFATLMYHEQIIIQKGASEKVFNDVYLSTDVDGT